MTGRLLRLLLIIILFFSINVQAATTVPVIVKLLPSANLSLITSLLGGTILDSLPGTNTYLLRLPALPLLTPLLKLLGVQWIESNQGLGLPGVQAVGMLGLSANPAPDWYKSQPSMQLIHGSSALPYSRGKGVVVADINSLLDYSHPALAGHLTGGYDFVTSSPVGNGGNLNDDQSTAGFLDDDQSTAGFLDDDQSTAGFLDANGLKLFDDQSTAGFLDGRNPAYSHATFCAGIIAVIAPDAMIMPLRAFDNNGNSDAFTLAKAIRYAAQHGAQVINMSFGTLSDVSVLREAIQYAQQFNIVLVASAGNNSTATPQYPASYSGVVGTASTDLLDKKASFSNYGANVFVDAPGVNIISAYPGGKYAMASGTSFSAPEVAGEAALLRSLRTSGIAGTISVSTVNVDKKNPGYVGKLGYGRIDVLKAVHP